MLPQIHSMGNIYSIYGSKYLLVGFLLTIDKSFKEYAALIHILSGNRYSEPVEVRDFNNISKMEFKQLVDKDSDLDKFQFEGKAEKILGCIKS